MHKREPLITDVYFLTQLELTNEEIDYYRGAISRPSPSVKLDVASFNLYSQLYKQIEASYSGGQPIDQLLPLFSEMIGALAYSYEHTTSKEKLFFVGEVDEYISALTLLSWGLLLKAPISIFDQLVDLIDSDGQHDSLVDVLITKNKPDRPQSDTLLFAKLYQPLYDAVSKRPVDEGKIVAFLKHWYTTCLKQTSTYNLHLKHGGDDSGFAGYWAWEVAGLTYALNIDDHTYRNMPYYPADLVDYARQK